MVLSSIEVSINKKIASVGIPLKNWNIKIYRGVLTGFNEAFIISGTKREEILNNCKTEEEKERTAELIRPILRGRDIERYGYKWEDTWLINTHNGIKGKGKRVHVEDLPSIKAHLDQYLTKLSRRADKGDTPYNLRNCAYLEDFLKPKIVWPRLMRISKTQDNTFPRFAYVEKEMFTVDSLCFFTGKDLELLCEVLNSDYAAYYFLKNVATLDSGGVQMRQQYVEHIPIPPLEKGKNVFDAFCFTKEEVRFIKDTVTELIAIAQSN